MSIIRGERVILRPMTEEDLPWKVKWINDQDVNRFIGLPPTTIEETREWFLRKSQNPMVTLFIIECQSKPIGFMRLDNEGKHKRGQLHLVIGEKELWGAGYGAEATRLFLSHCFDYLGLNKVYLYVLVENVFAVRVYEKCGFQKEGLLRQDFFLDGRFHDCLAMSILGEDYKHEPRR